MDKELRNIKKAIEILADLLENSGINWSVGTKKKVHDLIYHDLSSPHDN